LAPSQQKAKSGDKNHGGGERERIGDGHVTRTVCASQCGAENKIKKTRYQCADPDGLRNQDKVFPMVEKEWQNAGHPHYIRYQKEASRRVLSFTNKVPTCVYESRDHDKNDRYQRHIGYHPLHFSSGINVDYRSGTGGLLKTLLSQNS
jgi:hypothetical protein